MLSQVLAVYRHHRFSRQLRHIDRTIQAMPQHRRPRLAALTLREIGQGLPDEGNARSTTSKRYAAASETTELAYTRACSGNAEVALRGIALWLAAAYHQTRALPHPLLRPQHRQVLRVVRELKHMHGRSNQRTAGQPDWLRAATAA